MQDVSDKLLDQFVSCLEQRLGESAPEPAPEVATRPDPPVAAAVTETAAPKPPVNNAAPPTPIRATAPPPADDAIDLGATVLPVLIKSYWKQGAIALVALLVILRWIKR